MPGGRLPATLTLSLLALALVGCQTRVPPPTPAPEGSEFAGVRATAEAAYREGSAQLSRGELDLALASLDKAKMNDPDNRADIQTSLNETVRRIQALPTPPPAATRTPVPSPTPFPTLPPGMLLPTPTPPPNSPLEGFVRYLDPQGRFSVAAPAEWQQRQRPQVEFGEGIIGFRDPTGRAEVAVAFDPSTDVPSPELYAARMDLAMQTVPGYALVNAVPGVTANAPSLRRNFSLTQRDSTGRVTGELRGFQVTLLRGTVPFIISGTANGTEYRNFEGVFEQILGTFSFN
jgi:hypothetical protein